MTQNALNLQVVPPARHIRFGPFELDTRAGELRKHSIKIRLPQQSFQILFMLLKQPGEVVLREEIQQKLWPQNTAVEFDHSINAAIQKLRDSLGESAGKPRYVETVPRRGYRFIGTVETPVAEPVSQPAPPVLKSVESSPEPAGQVPASRSRFARVFTAVTLLGVLAIATWFRPGAVRHPVENWTLSLGAVGNAVVSPDGSAVAYRIPNGLAVRRMDSLTETPVYTLDRLTDTPSWSPDGSQLLLHSIPGLVRLPIPNGPPTAIWHNLGVTRGYAWAPDGTVLSAISSGKPDGGKLTWSL